MAPSGGRNGRLGPLPSMPSTPLRQYFSRRSSSRIRTNDLPLEPNAHGVYSPAGFFFIFVGLTVPFAYIYIALILFRELCVNFPDTVYQPLRHYVPWLANVVITMQKSSIVVEVWCVIEAIFYVFLKLKIQWLQRQDPLEASLSSAPMLELDERRELWDRMMEAEKDNPAEFISGWFFDEPIENISLYDLRDFAAWSMFEGRNQEHLTAEELAQLDEFVQDFEYRLSIHLYGIEDENGDSEIEEKKEYIPDSKQAMEGQILSSTTKSSGDLPTMEKRRPRPKKLFRFPEESHDEQTNFFTNLYEDFKHKYEQYRNMLENSEFHPVQDIRNFMAETRQHIVEVEESAVATATNMCENAYSTLVSPGSAVDKQLTAIGHATQVQLTEAWNSVKGMRERLETARFLSSQRKAIRQRLKGYRLNLNRMRSMSSAVPSKQMAVLMRKITECNDALERVEASARNSFMNATGFVGKNLLQRKEPQRYAKYSSDPLLGICTYPLGFHLLILAFTEGGLRIMMRNRGFVRFTVGPVAYYYHPGRSTTDDLVDDDDADDSAEKVPIVFVHGIGIGLVFYMPLIDHMLKSGRPILLPEIPYVNGFRPWQSPFSVLPPAVVVSSLTAMLATHGFLRGLFAGHSYGTSWLSYMCKYAPDAVAAVIFLDPICFCLHIPRLTKKFVYHRADPGVISYMIRTDMTINCTIQRSFPWARIVLFKEQIQVPCSVFLSERDELVPAEKVEEYLLAKGAPVKDFTDVDKRYFVSEDLNVTVFRGFGHGDWSERLSDVALVADCMDVMCTRVEREDIKER